MAVWNVNSPHITSHCITQAEYPIWMEEVEQVQDVEDGGGTVSPRGMYIMKVFVSNKLQQNVMFSCLNNFTFIGVLTLAVTVGFNRCGRDAEHEPLWQISSV